MIAWISLCISDSSFPFELQCTHSNRFYTAPFDSATSLSVSTRKDHRSNTFWLFSPQITRTSIWRSLDSSHAKESGRRSSITAHLSNHVLDVGNEHLVVCYDHGETILGDTVEALWRINAALIQYTIWYALFVPIYVLILNSKNSDTIWDDPLRVITFLDCVDS